MRSDEPFSSGPPSDVRPDLVGKVFEAAAVGLCLVDPAGVVLCANGRWLRSVGIESGAAIGRNLWDLCPTWPGEFRALHDKARTGMTVEVPPHRLVYEGREMWYEGRLSPVRLSNGTGLLITGFDITERRRAEEAVRESEERFRIMADGSPIILWVTDAKGGNLFVNRTYRETFGVTIDEVAGGRWQPFVHPEDALEYVGGFMRAVRDHAVFRGDARIRGKNGEWRWMTSHAEPRLSPSDGFLGHVGVTLDVTERRRLEEQLHQSQKLESIGRLAGGVAHDFNNLLTVIMSCVNVLKDDGEARLPTDLGVVADIGDAARRAADLTRQLLAFARKQVIAPVPLDMNAVVRGMENLLRRLLPEDIALVVTTRDLEPWPVRCDPQQLEQIIMNIAVNARDAMPDGGELSIETANVEIGDELVARHPFLSPGPHVRLTVTDTGVGMTDEVKANAFEPFFTTKGPGAGTGLGLAMVYGIVKQSGGYICVESELERGTSFDVYFPRSVEGPAETSPTPAVALGGTETILLAEDDPAIAKIVVRALLAAGYHVLVARSADEALDKEAKHDGGIHLLVTDLIMPGLNGCQLAAELRRRRPGLAVLYVSGYAGETISRTGMRADGDAFLQKPFTPMVLLGRIRLILDAR